MLFFRKLPKCVPTAVLVVGSCFLPGIGRSQEEVITPAEPIQLFDGESLDGWYSWTSETGYTDPNQAFSVVDGLLRLSGEGQGFLASNDEYSNYILVFEFRWGEVFDTDGPRAGDAKDSGILVHSNGGDGEWNSRLIPGIQSQMVEGGMGDMMIMAKADEPPTSFGTLVTQEACGPNTSWNCRGGFRWDPAGEAMVFDRDVDDGGHLHHRYWDPNWEDIQGFRGVQDTESPDGDWNQMVIIANGDELEIRFNGSVVNKAFGLSVESGKIQLQLERFEYFVRRLELLPLGSSVGPSITSNKLPAGMALVPYIGQVDVAGGTGNHAWEVSSGGLPSGLSLDPLSGVLNGSPLESGEFEFEVTVSDELGLEGSHRYQMRIDEFAPVTAALVPDGLVLHLDSAIGVDTSGSTVTGWNDQSGKGNHLTVSGSPKWGVAQTPTGRAAVSLDGSDDALERVAELVDFPVGNEDRTMFMVARYISTTWWGGVSYGKRANNESFGLNVKHPTGELVLHGNGSASDLVSSTAGVGAGWIVQSGMTTGADDLLILNGEVIGSHRHAYDTSDERLVIGEEIGAAGHVGMEVAAVLLYDRALSSRERENVEAYLRTRYLDVSPPLDEIPPAIDVPASLIVAQDDPGGAVVTFETIAIDGIDGMLLSSSEPASGSLFPTGETTVETTATDNAGNVATATFNVTVVSSTALAGMVQVELEVNPETDPDTTIRFNTFSGFNFALQSSNSVSDWETLESFEGDDQMKTYVHAGVASDSRRFYKVVISSGADGP
ncbi:family 16 glycoside hydrolase [Haloferula sp.]|uniref:family 16 glycoside hydrolase n=1 Tax=Haloferula sp. TaxID=2497595 RepID=UPI00329E017D